MQSKPHFTSLRRPLATAGLLAALTLGTSQAAVLIDASTRNGSFELVNGVTSTTKVQSWGNATNLIDNWTNWTGVSTVNSDSGTETWTPAPAAPAGPTGSRFAFLQPGNAVYNLTNYVAQVGDTFTITWDKIGTRSDAAAYSIEVSLVYFNGTSVVTVAGTAVTQNTAGTSYSQSFTVTAGNEAVGRTVGIGIRNPSSSYPEVDNFVLAVVPEPSSALLGLLGSMTLLARRRRR